MKLRLSRSARINHAAGETVDVSPDQARFLLAIHAAEVVPEKKSRPKAKDETNNDE